MDKEREIRFLYPPLIFVASLILGVFNDKDCALYEWLTNFINKDIAGNIIVSLIGGASIVLLLGFLLGTITVFLLRLLFWSNKGIYEIKLDQTTYKRIGAIILKKDDLEISKEEEFYAGVVFDHAFNLGEVHKWSVRRWNAFMISSSSVTSLVSALTIGLLIGIRPSCWWFFLTGLFTYIFIKQAYYSWTETMNMIRFMTRVKLKEKEDKSSL